jgi:hypothetical protein
MITALLAVAVALLRPGQVQEQDDEVVDSNILPYCNIDRKQKKTLGEMEQEFLQACQVSFITLSIPTVNKDIHTYIQDFHLNSL